MMHLSMCTAERYCSEYVKREKEISAKIKQEIVAAVDE